jgi:hypothetical protein
MKTKIERIAAKLATRPEVKKWMKSTSYNAPEVLAENLLRYVQAVRDGRVFCIIHSVSSSGMSRNMSFFECAKYSQKMNSGQTHGILNFYSLFLALGYPPAKEGFRISGCGMNMVFAVNYDIMHTAARVGAITEKECAKLAQMTPTYL